ncbi:MAG: TatD family hydrolase [candidate division WS1 bacterium]|nr:TatD family hydrolase [candidate division WS1 bacterium]
MIDTHVHLNHSDFADDVPAALDRAAQAGVQALIVVGYDLESNRDALSLAATHSHVYATIGLHPHCAGTLDEGVLGELRRMARERKVVGIGETGLDYYRMLSPRESQRAAFRALIELAQETQLPLVVHNREAHDETLEVLEACAKDWPLVMHCFSADEAFASECRERGYYVGLGGTLTYPGSEELRRIVAAYPGRRLLLETDAPWLAPQEERGKRNEPAYLRKVAIKLAEIRGESPETIITRTTANARRLFKLEARR